MATKGLRVGWYTPLRTTWWERYADPATAQDDESAFGEDSPHVRTEDASEALQPLLARLPACEAMFLALRFAGQSTRSISSVSQMSHQGVRKHISRAMLRLAWMTGPGAWFDGSELSQAAASIRLRGETSVILGAYWDSTSLSRAAERIEVSYPRVKNAVIRARRCFGMAALSGHLSPIYALGLAELDLWGARLLDLRDSTAGSLSKTL